MRERTDAKTGATSTETAYRIISVPADRARPERLLAWNRGHRQVENGNHVRRDASMGEDARASALANHATLNNIARAIVFHYLPEANRHCMMRRKDSLGRDPRARSCLRKHRTWPDALRAARRLPRACPRSRRADAGESSKSRRAARGSP